MIKTPNADVGKTLKRLHYPLDVMLTCVRWYVAYPLSLRHLEEMMSERAVSVDQSTVHQWAVKLLPVLGKAFGPRKQRVGRSCEWTRPISRSRGEWKYLYRTVDKAGDAVNFLFRAKRGRAAVQRYFEKEIAGNDVPETVTIDKSGASLAWLNAIIVDRDVPIKIRQSEVSEQLGRAGPSSGQTHRATNARI